MSVVGLFLLLFLHSFPLNVIYGLPGHYDNNLPQNIPSNAEISQETKNLLSLSTDTYAEIFKYLETTDLAMVGQTSNTLKNAIGEYASSKFVAPGLQCQHFNQRIIRQLQKGDLYNGYDHSSAGFESENSHGTRLKLADFSISCRRSLSEYCSAVKERRGLFPLRIVVEDLIEFKELVDIMPCPLDVRMNQAFLHDIDDLYYHLPRIISSIALYRLYLPRSFKLNSEAGKTFMYSVSSNAHLLTHLHIASVESLLEDVILSIVSGITQPLSKLYVLSIVKGLTKSNIGTILQSLKNENNRIEELYLDLHVSHVEDEDQSSGIAHELSTVLSHPNNRLKRLYFTKSGFDAYGLGRISRTLVNPYCKITHLHLPGTNSDNTGLSFIANALTHVNNQIKSLHLGHDYEMKWGKQGFLNLALAIKHKNCKLETLILQNMQLTSEIMKEFSDLLLKSANYENEITKIYSLKTLDFSYNRLQNQGLHELSRVIASPNFDIEKLVLIENYIDDGGLSSALYSLKYLDLSYNSISPNGFSMISTLMSHRNSQLKHLIINQNLIEIDHYGMECIKFGMTSPHNKLEELSLEGAKISSDALSLFREILTDPMNKLKILKLASITIDNNDIFSNDNSYSMGDPSQSSLLADSIQEDEGDYNIDDIFNELWIALQNPNCKLRVLNLVSNTIRCLKTVGIMVDVNHNSPTCVKYTDHRVAPSTCCYRQ